MKQQALEARLDRIKAVAEQAVRTGAHSTALIEIIRLVDGIRETK